MARGRTYQRLGLLCLGLGTVVLGWVAWQFWGTSWVSEQRHRDIVTAVERQWQDGADVAEVPEGQVGAVLRIPRFGPDFAVPLIDGTSDAVLAAGFGRYIEGARPGARGNLVVVGHRITHGEPLRRMPELEPGDEILVDTAGTTYTYLLDTAGDGLAVGFADGWVLDTHPRNPEADGVDAPRAGRLLTLVTCAELFQTDLRLVAFAHLARSEDRQQKVALTPAAPLE